MKNKCADIQRNVTTGPHSVSVGFHIYGSCLKSRFESFSISLKKNKKLIVHQDNDSVIKTIKDNKSVF